MAHGISSIHPSTASYLEEATHICFFIVFSEKQENEMRLFRPTCDLSERLSEGTMGGQPVL